MLGNCIYKYNLSRATAIKLALNFFLVLFSSFAFSKQISFDFSSEHSNFLFGHEIKEIAQYTDTKDEILLTVTPKSTSSPHLQQCHVLDKPHDIYVHQSFSGLGVKYRKQQFWALPFLDSGYLDTYGGYTDRLSFDFSNAITGEKIAVKVKNIRFKRFEPILFQDNAYIQDIGTGQVINVSKDDIDQNLFLELFPTTFLDEHTIGDWRFDTSFETSGFYITPGKLDAFKIYGLTIDVQEQGDMGPEITSEPILNAYEASEYNYLVQTVSNSADYEYRLNAFPQGMHINEATGQVQWTPSYEQSGDHAIDIAVTDAQGREASQQYVLTVVNTNRPAVISSTAIISAQENSVYTYQVLATDPDGDVLGYQLDQAPSGMSISNTGLINWQPSYAQAGQYEVLVRISDGSLNVAHAYSITVKNTNRIPVIESGSVGQAVENKIFSHQVLASDEDSQNLEFTLQNAPYGMTIDELGTINWTPTFQQSGNYIFIINVSDGEVNIEQEFTLIVENTNQKPQINATPIITAKEGLLYQYSIMASDPDGDSLSYALVSPPSGMNISNNGVISWLPSYEQAGDYTIDVQVSDLSDSAFQVFLLNVENVNRAPLITSTPSTQVDEGKEYLYQLVASDPDSDLITYELLSGPIGMVIHSSGSIEWTPSFQQSGVHSVKVQVSDQALSDQQNFSITVNNVNRLPIISSIDKQYINEGNLFSYQLEATDPDGDTLSYQINTELEGLTVDVDGLINWQPLFDQSGEYNLIIEVLDGLGKSSAGMTIIVEDINRLPIITSAPLLTGSEGSQYQYQVIAIDADNDSLTYNLLNAPVGMEINKQGLLNWTPDYVQAGMHSITVRVSDTGSYIDQTFSINVANTNRAPVISSQPNIIASENSNYQYIVSATDQDQDALTYSLTASPTGMSINTSGMINWVPSFDQSGNQTVSLKVSDGEAEVSQTFEIVVADTNRKPTITSIASASATENVAYQYQVSAEDADAQALTYQLEIAPAGMTTTATGLVSWTPGFDQSGNHLVVITVTDSIDTIKQAFTLVVENTNRLPIFTSTPILTSSENVLYQYQVSATDADNDSLAYKLLNAPVGMAINEQGMVSWIPSYAQSGDYEITLELSDGTDTAQQVYTLSVTNTNQSPIFTSTPLTEIFEKETYQYAAVAQDPDGEILQYSLILAPQGLSIDSSTGMINWETTASDIGSHYIVINAVDESQSQAEQGFTITVLNVNDAPIITSIPVDNGFENQLYEYQIIATDEDNDSLTYMASGIPAGMTINQGTGLITWLPNFQQSGFYHITVQVSDESGLTFDQVIDLTINNINRAPQITSDPILEIEVGTLYQYQVQAADLDNDELLFELTNAPLGMTIDSSTGLIQWVGNNSQVGEVNVEVAVSDPYLLTAYQSYILKIVSSNNAPKVIGEPILSAVVGHNYLNAINVIDAENDRITFKLIQAPDFISMTQEGVLTGTPSEYHTGIAEVKVSLSDGVNSVIYTYALNTVELNETGPANWGKDFWFADALDSSEGSPALRVFITSKVDTQGVIESPRSITSFSQEFTVQANQVTTIDFPSMEAYFKHDDVSGRGVHVLADDNVSVYVLLYNENNTDAMSLIPTDALGNEYRLSGYRAAGWAAGEYAIVATQDNTVLTFTPSGQMNRSTGELVLSGDSYTVLLEKGDIYSLFSLGDLANDLTGSLLKANKPISVFTTHSCHNVPTTDNYCDRLTEQLPAVNQWGYNHAIVPLYSRYGDLIRILADKNNTRISIDGVETKLLQAGEFWQYILNDAQWVSSSEPVLVTQFSTSDTYDKEKREQDDNHLLTDWRIYYGKLRSQMLDDIPTYQTEYTVSINTSTKNNFVILVVPDDKRDSIYVDGELLSANIFPNRDCGNTCSYAPYNLEYAIGQVALSVGEHTISSDAPFGLYENVYSLALMADPFMAVVPPVDLSQDTYIFTTPVTEYARNFTNIVLPTNAVDSLMIDGESVDAEFFTPLSTPEYSYARLAVNAGRHVIEADQNFSLLVYGYDSHDSYGFIGGYGHSSPLEPEKLTVNTETLQPETGSQFCVRAQVTDVYHQPLQDTVVGFSLMGTHSSKNAVFTEDDGVALYCYQGYLSGNDTLNVTVGTLSKTLTLDWQQSHSVSNAPVIISTPLTYIEVNQNYEYIIRAVDPEGEGVTYHLKQAPVGMDLDQENGVVTWLATSGSHKVIIEAADEKGNISSQVFSISANSLPVIIQYPANPVDNRENYRSQYIINDADGDPIFCKFISAPDKFSLNPDQCSISYVDSMPAGDYPISVEISDGRGGNLNHSYILHVVQNHSPVITNVDMNASGFIDETMMFQIQAEDANNDPLTLKIKSARLNGLYFDISRLVIDYENFTVQWTPEGNEFGVLDVSFQIDHPFNFSAEGTISFNVENRDFTVTSLPTGNARVGFEYQYVISLDDPDNQSMSYTLLESPEGMAVDNSGFVRWTPTSLQEGFASIRLQVSDGKNIHGQEFELSVQGAETNMTTQLYSDKRVVDSGEIINIGGGYIHALGDAIETLTLDNKKIPLDENGKAQITISESGAHTVAYTVKDNVEEVSKSLKVYVKDPSDIIPALADLITPAQNTEVTTLVDVTATVTDEQLIYWQLLLQKGNTGEVKLLAEGDTEIIETSIAIIDPTLMMNGLYTLTLMAVDLGGNESFSQVNFPISGNLKVGNMSFTVQDLSISVAGIPVTVNRSYDSRRRNENLDFGHGWSVDYQSIQVDESLEPTQGWYQYESRSQFVRDGSSFSSISYCIAPIGEKKITVTLPDGTIERFKTTATAVDGSLESKSHPGCYFTSGHYYKIAFVPEGDTRSTLQLGEYNDHSFYLTNFNNGHLAADIIDGTYTLINQYQLTTQAGYVYQLDQNFGIKIVTDPSGNTLTYSESGIIHSDGKSVLFNRDKTGRIKSIVDPAGQTVMNYEYSAVGDLRFVKDASTLEKGSNGVEYTYTLDHNIVDIIDPLGRPIVKNLYDENGRLTGQEDANGNVKTFDHDINAGTSLVTDLDGRSTLLNYDDKGNVTQDIKIISDGSYDTDIVTGFAYDANDNQTAKTIGAAAYTWLSHFDDNSHQLTATDPEGNIVEYKNYNARGQEGTIVDELGRETGMEYDGIGNLLEIKMPALTDPDTGIEQQLTAKNIINNRGQITQTTDLRGLITTYTYYSTIHESAGQKHTESNAISGTTTYTYDANNNVKTESRERTVNGSILTETVSYDYDARNRLTKTTYPDTTYTETVYDLAGNVDKERDRFGIWTEFEYDGYGRLTRTDYADNTFETREYTAEGLLKSVADVSGNTTRYEYDDAGRLYKTINHDDSFTQTRYTPQGWVKSEIDTRGALTEYQYDLAGKRKAILRHIEGKVLTHSFEYYDNGELKSETDANGHTTSYSINAFDQRTQTTYQNTTIVGQRYDAMGARLKQIDQNQRATQYGYDDLGRLLSVQAQVQINNEDVPATSYTYDQVGNKLTQTDAKGRITSWTYDYFGRILSRTLPEGMSETYYYDDANRTLVHTDFNKQVTTTISDIMGRVSSIAYADDKVEHFTYWPAGQLKTATTSKAGQDDSVVTYTYDNRDRLKTETQSNGTVLGYQYDTNGNRTQVKVTSTEEGSQKVTTVDYTYDDLNRLKTVIDNSGTTTYHYDDVGNQKTITYPNGLVTEYTYNNVNQLTNLITKNESGEVLSSYTYQLDDTGRRENITESSGRYTDYDYDNLYRLTDEVIKQSIDATSQDYRANYQYDWVGNRTYETVDGVSTAYSYDLNDRLTSQGGTTYSYDNNGNTLTETLDAKVKTYAYDAKNKLIGVSTTESDVEVSSSAYSYNVNGIRNSKTEGGVTTSYVVDSNRDYAQVLEEIVDGLSTVTYSYGHDLLSQNRSDEFKFYLYDGLGSTRGLSNSAGVVTDSYDYEAFGEVLNETGTTDNNYKFTGEQFDASLDQYYLRARYYDQGIGRFTQQDTYMGNNSDPVSLHKYLYANAAPSMYTDPTGNFSVSGMMTSLNIMGRLAGTAMNTYSNATMLMQIANGEMTASDLALSFLASKLIPKRLLKCNSFTSQTLVSTENGLKSISSIKIGDKVWAYNSDTGERALQEVTHLIQGEGSKELVDIRLATGDVITATGGHPFFNVDIDQWLDASELSEGDALMTLSNKKVYVRSIDRYINDAVVYNLTIDNDHTYFVGRSEVLSHNIGACKFPTINTKTRNHILRGDISSGGRITGYHHRFAGSDSGKLKLLEVTRSGRGSKGGQGAVYEGWVGFIGSNGQLHKKRSTFFPDNWTSERVMSEVNSALTTATLKGQMSGTVRSKSASGLLIEMKINGGVLESAYPILR